MKQHVLQINQSLRVIMWEDGEIIVEGNIATIEQLLYIAQEYQEIFGPIKVRIDPSQWRGITGA
jgi:hypothetical protein